jgi:hypothetical protein
MDATELFSEDNYKGKVLSPLPSAYFPAEQGVHKTAPAQKTNIHIYITIAIMNLSSIIHAIDMVHSLGTKQMQMHTCTLKQGVT